MITLDLTNEFTFNTSDGTELTGTFRDLNIKEKADFETKAQKNIKLANKVNKLIKRIERNKKRIAYFESENDFNQADTLEDENEGLQSKLDEIADDNNPNAISNDLIKERVELCLGGRDRETILGIAEKIGYKRVFEVIQEAIIEGKLES